MARRSVLVVAGLAAVLLVFRMAHGTGEPRPETRLMGRKPFGEPGRTLFVVEIIPSSQSGGGMRTREMLALSRSLLAPDIQLHARSPWTKHVHSDGFFGALGIQIVGEERDGPMTALQPTFHADTGRGREIVDLEGLASRSETRLRYAVLSMWSFHVAPSGDAHLTIPEVYLPRLRRYAPATCAIVLSDDIQHRRFAVEGNLSAASVARLAERELAAYEAADVVLFVSKEDTDDVTPRRLEPTPLGLSSSHHAHPVSWTIYVHSSRRDLGMCVHRSARCSRSGAPRVRSVLVRWWSRQHQCW
jgi:hypothetical protein